MGKLSPDKIETVEVEAVAFTDAQIQKGLETWTRNLATAKAASDIFAADTASTWLDMWLDRKLKATG